jgi:pyruvate ferredoxin oxidoreductase alpha subunit
VMVGLDGFILTHAIENLQPLPDEMVKEFVGEFKPKTSLLDIDHPITLGPLDLQNWYFEHKYQQVLAMRNVPQVVNEVFDEFEKISGRRYNVVEPYMVEDADYVVMAIGSTAGTLRYVVDQLREEGMKLGSIKLRMFRPFPEDELVKLLSGKKAVAVMDRAISFGAAGPVFPEVRSAMLEVPDAPKIVNYIYGLGGRDVSPDDIKTVFKELVGGESERVNYLGVRK